MNLSGRTARTALVAGLLVALAASGCGTGPSQSSQSSKDEGGPEAAYSVAAGSPSVRVVAVGDIACPPGEPAEGMRCRHDATADLTKRINPAFVLTLGDHQYEDASQEQFRDSYDKSWGALRSKTFPAPGNHEYRTPGASDYYTYFKDRQPGPPGYYRVTSNGWNIYVLNSNCGKISCSTQAAWLDRQMAANPSRCSIIAMHHPRYSSGPHGNATSVRGLWKVAYKHRTDVALAGHDHNYERFRPMDASGHVRRKRGIASFVSGAGGKNLYRLGKRKRGSANSQARTAGVLVLDLKQGSYSWGFRGIDGSVMDSGSRRCR